MVVSYLKHEKHGHDLRCFGCYANDVTTKAMRVKTLETGDRLFRHGHNEFIMAMEGSQGYDRRPTIKALAA